ncbi:hypothetical protein RTBOTA2_000380 [Rhodotorula toruloides]|nr:hypothetical protein RTBOTA2_000380 [Rhodotorula toruloides]
MLHLPTRLEHSLQKFRLALASSYGRWQTGGMGEVALLQLAGGCRLAGGGQCGTGHCCTGAAQCPYGRLELCYSLVRSLRSLPSLPSTPLHTMAVRFFATSSHLRVHKRNIVWRSTVTLVFTRPDSPPSTVVRGRRAASPPGEVEREPDHMAGRIRGREASERAMGQASSPAGMALQGRTQS